jgi:cation diffusion facilitator CzcD-associated flavoprotein CzcO
VAHRVLKGRGDSMNESVDVIIIGAGSAGLAALREVKKRTERFVVINDGPWGRTAPGSKDSDLSRGTTAPRSRSPAFAGRAIAVQK